MRNNFRKKALNDINEVDHINFLTETKKDKLKLFFWVHSFIIFPAKPIITLWYISMFKFEFDSPQAQ